MPNSVNINSSCEKMKKNYDKRKKYFALLLSSGILIKKKAKKFW